MSDEPSVFSLIKLLEGRHPQWKLLSKSSLKHRKKVQYFENPPKKSEFGDGVIKKSQIAGNDIDDPTFPKWKFKGKRDVTFVNKKRKLAGMNKFL